MRSKPLMLHQGFPDLPCKFPARSRYHSTTNRSAEYKHTNTLRCSGDTPPGPYQGGEEYSHRAESSIGDHKLPSYHYHPNAHQSSRKTYRHRQSVRKQETYHCNESSEYDPTTQDNHRNDDSCSGCFHQKVRLRFLHG